MATMRETRHELLKAKWKEIIRAHDKSGISIRKWCESQQISARALKNTRISIQK